jgi:hypothetical protein
MGREAFMKRLLFIADCCSFSEGKVVANPPPPRQRAGQAATARPLTGRDIKSSGGEKAVSSAVDARMARDNFDEGLRGGKCHV